jgi:hypothetical protein
VSSHQRTAPKRSFLKSGRVWPWIIVGIFVVQGAFIATVITIATGDDSFGVEPDYYEKALAWDATAAELRTPERLGWDLELAVSHDADSGQRRRVAARVIRADGTPLNAVTLDVEAFAQTRSGERVHAALSPEGAGWHSARVPMPTAGTWEFRVRVSAPTDSGLFVRRLPVTPPASGTERAD